MVHVAEVVLGLSIALLGGDPIQPPALHVQNLAGPVNADPILYDFFVDTPPSQPGKELDFFSILVDFGPSKQEFHIGQGSVAIPGNTAGLCS